MFGDQKGMQVEASSSVQMEHLWTLGAELSSSLVQQWEGTSRY